MLIRDCLRVLPLGLLLSTCSAVVVAGEGVGAQQSAQEIKQLERYYSQELAKLQKLELQLNALAEQQEKAAKAGNQEEVARIGREYHRLKQGYDEEVNRLRELKARYQTLVAQADASSKEPAGEDLETLKAYYNQELVKLQKLEAHLNALAEREAGAAQARQAGKAAAARAVAAEPRFRQDGPSHYVVREGDTLWRVSSLFLKDPHQWERFWHDNPRLQEPRQIHPGDVVSPISIEGKPRLQIARRADEADAAVRWGREYDRLKPAYTQKVAELSELKERILALSSQARQAAPAQARQAAPAQAAEPGAIIAYYNQELAKLRAMEERLKALEEQRAKGIRVDVAMNEMAAKAAEAEGGLLEGHPEGYVVKPNDTLWDISAQFLKDPHNWPNIWHDNPEIENPHLIYPGDVVSILYVSGKPRLQVERRAADGDEMARLDREYDALKNAYENKARELAQLQQQIRLAANTPPRAEKASNNPESQPSKSVQTLLQEEHALFAKRLTLETGFTYNRYDRQQLVLSGFLALDAIFLGNIAIEGVESDTFRYDFGARYGLTDRLNLNLNVPFQQRSTTYQKGGAGGTSAIIGEAEVSRSPEVGDVTLGLSYHLLTETKARPDVVLNLSLMAPTGDHPYGVKTRELPTSEESISFQVPEELPTGSGVWGGSVGLSFVSTLDPAILFANFGYTYTHTEDFDDISSTPDNIQPGKVSLGDSWQYGVGMAFALNDRMSLSMAYSHSITGTSKTKPEDGEWSEIIGSDSNAASLNFGVTYGLSKHLSLVTNVGSGLTSDAPDVSFSMKLPYNF